MRKTIMNHLTSHPSYFKKSATFLANKFGCSPKTIVSIFKTLETERSTYYKSLKRK